MTAAGCNEYPLKAACRWCLFQARAASAERARELVGTTGQSGRLSQDAARRAPMCVEAHLIPCGAAHGRRRRYRQAQRVGVRDGSPKGRDSGSMRSTTARSETPRRTAVAARFFAYAKMLFLIASYTHPAPIESLASWFRLGAVVRANCGASACQETSSRHAQRRCFQSSSAARPISSKDFNNQRTWFRWLTEQIHNK